MSSFSKIRRFCQAHNFSWKVSITLLNTYTFKYKDFRGFQKPPCKTIGEIHFLLYIVYMTRRPFHLSRPNYDLVKKYATLGLDFQCRIKPVSLVQYFTNGTSRVILQCDHGHARGHVPRNGLCSFTGAQHYRFPGSTPSLKAPLFYYFS